ncbi:MAG: Glu/Leu/Phe/Val dehydrogenase [Deltaproteobacteria bacterium]|nr:Glu/Leu/Phe/Val dehydrogenase [Deltaproteobacteria bacterium]
MMIQKIETETGHEEVVYGEDPASGLKSIIAIHSTVLGPALGGVRMWPYASKEEALRDVLRLSRAMSYKASVSGLDLGGGKAVIIGDPRSEKSPGLLKAFGRFVASREGRYITAKDVGTTTDDLEIIAQETKFVGGRSYASGGSDDPSPMTAYGIYEGIKATVRFKWQKESLKGLTFAIQGMGHVGYGLAKHLHQEGAGLVVCDIHPENAKRAETTLGATVVSPEKILDVEADVFSPCALGGGIHAGMIERLKAPVIAGGANNQLLDEMRDGDLLHDKNILYAPDYVINAGGIINIFAELDGYQEEKARRKTAKIAETLTKIFEESRRENRSTPRIALKIAEDRINNTKKN